VVSCGLREKMPESHAPPSSLNAEVVHAHFAVGQLVGDYTLDSCVAQGSLAEVWRARRSDDPHGRAVALKLSLAKETQVHLLQRTARAREILSRLSHPNIVRLYDAGIEKGQAFFVLEWVEGRPLNEYCTKQRLTLRERVRLFAQVVNAVQNAHSHLLVHGELRPTNILVDDEGVVKLVDFGLMIPSDFGERMKQDALPIAYASPERLRGEALNTSSDLYSLGAVLYCLTTGQLPYPSFQAQASPLSASHQKSIVLNETPVRPSTAPINPAFSIALGTTQQALRKDLADGLDETILTAMARDPHERYDAARMLSNDLRAWLAGTPVSVHPPSRWYATRKFVERNRGGVALGIAGLSAVLASAGIAAWQSHIARTNAAATLEVKQFLVDTLSAFSARRAGGLSAQASRQTSAEQLVHHAASQLQNNNSLAPSVRFELLGVVGDLTYELQMNDDAVRLREQRIALAPRPGDAADDLRALIDAHFQAGNTAQVTATLARARALAEYIPAAQKPRYLGQISFRQGRQLALTGSHAEAMSVLSEAAKTLKSLSPPDDEWLEAQSHYLASLRLTKPDEALAGYKQLITTVEQMYGADAPAIIPVVKAYTLSLARQRRVDEALVMFTRMETLNIKHPNFDPVSRYEMLLEKGSMLRNEGNLAEARSNVKSALEGFEKMGLADHPTQPLLARLVMADLDSVEWNFAQSEASFVAAERVAEKADSILNVSFIRGARALNYMYQGQHGQARTLFNEARAARLKSLPPEHGSFALVEARAIHNEALAGNTDNALKRYAALKKIEAPAHQALLSEARFTAAQALIAAKQWQAYLADSEDMLVEARGVQRKILIHLARAQAFSALRDHANAAKSLAITDALAVEAGQGLPQPLRAQIALQHLLSLRAANAKAPELAKASDRFKAQRALLKGEAADFTKAADAI
jgi:eukaryotic-like serine/threonine-protein kinase